MTTQTEALRLALEALQFALHVGFPESSESQIKKGEKAYQQHRAAITAIKEALAQPDQDEVDIRSRLYQRIHELETQLAQPKQEPVAWEQFYPDIGKPQLTHPPQGIYYTPPQRTWLGLTEEDLKLLSAEWRIVYGAWMDDFARDIEAKLKEKNNA